MSEVSFPGDGQDGEQPPPAGPARDEAAGIPRDGRAGDGSPGAPGDDCPDGAPAGPEDDWDPDAEMAAFIADLEAGRARIPEEWEIEDRPAATISLGDAADVDLAELAAMLGPDGLGGEIFAQDRPADVMRPGPVLSALTEGAVGEAARLTDDQVLGAISAARRLAARAEYLELQAVAEFTRRRERQCQAARARKVPPGRRPGEFADAELAMELVTSANAARDRMGLASDLETRLPATRAALAGGMIDGYRAVIIWRYTRFLTDADAARADAVLAPIAPALRYDQLGRKAAALEMKLDPEAVKRGKEQARADRQRVEACRENSGNASLSGRELAIEDVLASKAHIDALAARLRNGGLPGSLRRLRVQVFLDLTQGRNPLGRLTAPRSDGEAGQDVGPGTGSQEPAGRADTGRSDADGDGDEDGQAGGRGGTDEDDDQSAGGFQDTEDDAEDDIGEEDATSRPGTPSTTPAPFPALVNLTIPVGTLFGWSAAPGDAGGWGLLDPDDTRRLVAAASQHPRTRLCATLVGTDGTAVAHGCARGQHPWIPAGGERDRPAATCDTTAGHGPGAGQAAELMDLLRRLNIRFTPIVKGTCDHSNAEDRYTPSRKLKHVVRARTATCPAPGCGALAYYNDLDHTVPHPGGPTDQCNLSPPCRRHHRCKQAPGWQLTQPEPGVMRWEAPSGRVYTTHPSCYDV